MIKEKISIIGAGFVGSTTAYTLVLRGLAAEIVLIDVNKEKAEGEALDMSHGLSFVSPVKIVGSNEYSLIQDSDIVIISAGVGRKPGESRLDLFKKNAEILRGIMAEVVKYCHEKTVILIISNPVDLLTYAAYRYSGFTKNRVIGSGTMLDTSRLKYYVGEFSEIDVRSVNTYIIGEHGDSEVTAWSMTSIGGMSLEQFCSARDRGKLREIHREELDESTRNAGQDVIRKKGATYYAIALAASRIVECIIGNESSVLTISSLFDGEYGLRDVCLSVPTIVSGTGAERILETPFAEDELAGLRKSGEFLRAMYREIGL